MTASKEDKKEAVKTYIEQTKLLVTLSSAFVFAPAAAEGVLKLELSINTTVISAEILFILSILFGYVVLGTIAGSQHKGEYDVYRPATMISSLVQLLFYVVGLAVFVIWIIG